MIINQLRISRTINRCAHELMKFMNQTTALKNLLKHDQPMSSNFFRVVYYSLYDSRILHLIKVLDEHRDSVGFWYLYKFLKPEIKGFCESENLKIDDLELLTKKLKHIRDKTHFHIGKKEVVDPGQVWKDASLTGDFINNTGEGLFKIIMLLFEHKFGRGFSVRLPGKIGDLVKHI